MATYGTWGNGIINVDANFNLMEPAYTGWRFILKWIDFETSAGVFDYSYVLDQLSEAETRGWDFSISIDVSPANGGSPKTPAWLFSAPYSVPLVTTTTAQYPYYLNAAFQTRYHLMLDALRDYIVTLSSSYKTKFSFWLSTEGKTGDNGPYAGTITDVTINGVSQPSPSSYNITDADWQTHKRANIWPLGYTNVSSDLPDTDYAINGGNDFADFQWGLDNIPDCDFKAGFPTHTYSNGSEKYYTDNIHSLFSLPTDNRTFGEFQNILDLAWFQTSYKQNFFSIVCSALHHGVDILSINTGNPQQMFPADLTPFQFFNKYAGIRAAIDTNKGFCALRDMIDVNDTTRFPESAPYGTVVDPSRITAYTNALNAIIASGQSDQQKQSRKTDLLVNYLNPARITYLRSLFPTASYHVIDDGEDQDAYNQEFGVDLIPDNYNKFITQYSPNTTSVGKWRVGSTDSFYGRYSRAFDNANGKTEMFFTLDEDLAGGGNNSTLSVTYYDEGTGIWSVNCATCKGKSEMQVVQNKNTLSWKTVDMDVDNFTFGGELENGSDFTLKYLSGSDTTFAMIEYVNNSKV